MPAAPVTLDQISLQTRARRGWVAGGGALALVGLATLVPALLAEAWGGAFAALVVFGGGAAIAHMALTARLDVHEATLAVRSPWNEREVRLDRLTTVTGWRGRFGNPHLALDDHLGNRVVLSTWFWGDAHSIEAVVGVALAEHDDVGVTDRLANRLDDAACARFG